GVDLCLRAAIIDGDDVDRAVRQHRFVRARPPAVDLDVGGDVRMPEQAIEQAIQRPQRRFPTVGEVALVGAYEVRGHEVARSEALDVLAEARDMDALFVGKRPSRYRAVGAEHGAVVSERVVERLPEIALRGAD